MNVITAIIAFGVIIGAVDKLRDNKWKLGEKFDEGLASFAALIVIMGGILAITPLLSKFFSAYLLNICRWIHLEPASLPGMFLANDCGAYHLAHSFGSNAAAADFGGMLVGGIIGVHFIFTIPVAVGMTSAEDYPCIIKGLFCGMTGAIPGLFIGGLLAGNSAGFVLMQLIPVLAFILIAGVFFLLCPARAVKSCIWLGKAIGVIALVAICLLFGVTVTGAKCVSDAIPMMPLAEIVNIVGMIALSLPGAYVAAELFARVMRKPLTLAGERCGVNHIAMSAMIVSLANTLPVFGMTGRMNPLGKCVAYAFMAGSSFAFGDHLAFCTVTDPALTMPMLTAKLTTAISGAILAWLVFRRDTRPAQES